MKKLVLFAVALIAVSFASCGPKALTPEEIAKKQADSIAVEVAKADSIAKEVAKVDSIAKEAAKLDSIAKAEVAKPVKK